MPNINDVINTLSDEELDLLNSDPEMLAAFKKKYQPDEGSHVTAGDVGRAAWDTVKDVGTLTKAGYAGVADLIAGNGLDKSVENIGHVKKDEDVTSGAAVFGEAFGDQFTPAQIAMQAALGKIGEMVGPWVASTLKGWGEKAALNAVGMIRSIADTLNVDLSSLAQFLMKPIQLGGQTFEPIVQATSSTADMLKDARVIQRAAGKNIEAVANRMDDAINGAIAWAEENAETPDVILNLKAMKPAIEELKSKAVGGLEEVAPDVVQKFDGLVRAMDGFAKKQETGTMATSFSDLSALKTKLGGLTNFKSQTENNLAMQQAYGVMAQTLSKAADKIGGSIGEEYAAANSVYHQVTAVINALEGKETKFVLKDLFAPGTGAFLGSLVGGLPGMVVGAGAGAVSKAYGHQAVAAGLNAAHPLVGKGIEVTARGIPVVARAVADALTLNKADGQ